MRAKLPYYCLVLLTALSLWIFLGILISDGEAKIIGAGLGGTALAILSPFWLLYTTRVPLVVRGLGLLVLIMTLVQVNCWAAAYAGTRYTKASDYIMLWLYPMPGLLWVALRHYLTRVM